MHLTGQDRMNSDSVVGAAAAADDARAIVAAERMKSSGMLAGN